MKELLVRHIHGAGLHFEVRRGDKGSQNVAVTSPVTIKVGNRSQSNLLEELRWYLEEYLRYPYPPNTDRAASVVEALKRWGQQAFAELFDDRDAMRMFEEATADGYAGLRLKISSDEPAILHWPWEALCDPKGGYLSVKCELERRLETPRDPAPLLPLPTDRLNILLVTARPYENDVHFRSISRPLVELVEQNNIPAYVHVLRPPSLAQLRKHLRERPGYYHVLHFDGHGGYRAGALPGGAQHARSAAEGVLVFEKDDGTDDPVNAEQLSNLLGEYAVPLVVLNACQSAMQAQASEDAFASVAAALLQAGTRGVAAMSYSLYVSGAQEFLPSFYRELFERGDLSRAARAGRQQMFAQQERLSPRGPHPLWDWVVPVVYSQEPYSLPSIKVGEDFKRQTVPLPPEALDSTNPYGFIGRDAELLKLERALRLPTPAVLVQGLGGVGKTTLARGLLKWLAETEGMEGCVWIGFQQVRSAEYVVNAMGAPLFGPDFLSLPMEEKLPPLIKALREHRIIVVWDNFESVSGIPGTHIQANLPGEDRQLLLDMLRQLRGGKGKVVITSRSDEDWLGPQQRVKLSIGGLQGEERWEYCEKILGDLGLKVDRNDGDLERLLDKLNGHALAMYLVLPRVEQMGARRVLQAIETNLAALGPLADELYAAIRLAEEQLDPELRPLLVPLGLHEAFVHAGLLHAIAEQVDAGWTADKLERFLSTLVAGGLLRNLGSGIFELHPALTSYLRNTLIPKLAEDERQAWVAAFVDVVASIGIQVAPLPMHEQRPWFQIYEANFTYALEQAQRLDDKYGIAAMLQLLGIYSRISRRFQEAVKCFTALGEQFQSLDNENGSAAAYHQLGMIADEQRNYSDAERWYLKSLEIKERLGDEQSAASTYHQLGMVAQGQRNYSDAERWYLKSLEIKERLGDEQSAASTYHQLGMIAQEQRDYSDAERWYLKSLEIEERIGNEEGVAASYFQLGANAQEQKDLAAAQRWYLGSLRICEHLGIEHGMAKNYHQPGMIAQEQRNYSDAERWYLKSLEIEERIGNEEGVAASYFQLGANALKQKDLAAAQRWYLKSLEIEERLSNEYGAAKTYHQLGTVAQEQHNWISAANLFLRSLMAFLNARDKAYASYIPSSYLNLLTTAPVDVRPQLEAMWREAGFGDPPDGWPADEEPEPEPGLGGPALEPAI